MATNAERQAAFRQRRDARIRERGEALRNPAANVEIATLRTLHWANFDVGAGRRLSKAEPYSGAYAVHWHVAVDVFEANFSPWGKNNRRRKTQPIGDFESLDEARAACQEHARAQKV
jgi:hypothetical protein